MLTLIKSLLVFFLVISCCSAEIMHTSELQKFKDAVLASNPEDTLILFDIDMVLIMPTDQIYIKYVDHSSKPFLDSIYEDYKQRYSAEEVKDLLSLIKLSEHVRAVTPNTLSTFSEIKDKGYTVLGLTFCETGAYGYIDSLEQWRINELKSHGFEFSNKYPDLATGSLNKFIQNAEYKDECYPAFHKGVIFTCRINKNKVLQAFLDKNAIHPKKIIFIDDKLSNVNDLAEHCAKNNIEFIGVEYNAVKDYAKNIEMNPRLARVKFAVLDHTKVWLTDEQVEKILQALDHNP